MHPSLATDLLASSGVAPIDWVIVVVYGVFVVAVGVLSKRRQEDADDYLLGGRRLPWWAIGVSLIATSFSSLSLLGMTGLGYKDRLLWFQLQIGDLAGIGIVALVFMPFFAAKKLTTAYEFLEVRLGRTARLVASAIFHLFVLARAGLLLFVTAKAGALLLGVPEPDWDLCILAVGFAAIAYSAVGGLGAVVWTDTVQLLLVIVGIVACLALVVGDLPGGLGDVLSVAADARAEPVFLDASTDSARFPTLWSSLFAYGLLALSVAGTNQQSVQRYLACTDLSRARRAAMLGWAIGAVTVLLTLLLGMALFAWYQGRPAPADPILSTFMADRVPPGLTGVLIAAILAASMSSMDSAIHSMATASLVDFVEPLRRRPFATERGRLRAARQLTLLHGMLAIGAAFIALGEGDHNVIALLVRWLAYLAGPMLGLFLIAMFEPKVGERAALVGLAAGYVAAIVLNDAFGWWDASPLARAGIHHIWTVTWTLATTYAVAGLASLFTTRSRVR